MTRLCGSNTVWRLLATVLIFNALSTAQCTNNSCTDPAFFTAITEIPLHGAQVAVPSTSSTVGVDNQSTIRIHFDSAKMAAPGPAGTMVKIRIEAYWIKGTSRTPIAPIHPYVDTYTPPAPAGAAGAATGTIVFHDHFFDPKIPSLVPDADINLLNSAMASADSIELRILNVETQQAVNLVLIPQPFGFHFKVSDTLMFVKRLGIGTKEKQAGISDFNFGPSPGVAYGGTYYARRNAFLRFIQPGAAINVMFTKWDNPAFDVSTGQFVPGTKASDIQTAMGGQFTLFGNVIQLGYGANLQVDQKRTYFGVGVSFVNLTTKIAGMISK